VQTPITHVWFTHATGALHEVPVGSQVCAPLPEHWVDPGTQIPPQVVPEHTYGQGLGALHVPSFWHISTPPAEHCVVPGAHTPAHAPFEHAWFVQSTGVLQVPSLWHVSTPLPEHTVPPGIQMPRHTPFTHAEAPQCTGALHVPSLAQVSTPLSVEHCTDPGVHIPAQPFVLALHT
jgi:hypothetical protein